MSRSAPMLAAGLLCLGLLGCALAGSRPPTTYDLVAPRSFAGAAKPAPWQLVVYEPTAVHALETDRIMVRPSADQVSYYKGIAWSDRLPRLVQARMIETFQNSGAVKAVSASTGQYALATELRAFQIDVSSGKRCRRDRDLRQADQCELRQGGGHQGLQRPRAGDDRQSGRCRRRSEPGLHRGAARHHRLGRLPPRLTFRMSLMLRSAHAAPALLFWGGRGPKAGEPNLLG